MTAPSPTVDLHTIVVELGEAGPDPFDRWVVGAMATLIDDVRAAVDRGRRAVAVVLVLPRTTNDLERSAAQAAWQAARGIVHAATLETRARPVLNLVGVTAGESPTTVESVTKLLAAPNGGFVVGASFDLRAPGQAGGRP